MSLRDLAELHVRRLERFLTEDRDALLRIRVRRGGEQMVAKLLAKVVSDRSRPMVMCALAGDFEEEAAFVARGVEAFSEQIDAGMASLADVGVDMTEIEPYVPPTDPTVAGAAALALVDWLERVQRRADPLVQKIVMLVLPERVADPVAFAAMLTAMAAATSSPAVQLIFVDTSEEPRWPRAISRHRLVRESHFRAGDSDHEIAAGLFRDPRRRVCLLDRDQPPRLTSAELRSASRADRFVKVALPLTDRWTFFRDLDAALSCTASELERHPSWGLSRANLAARFTEQLERTIGTGQTALVWLEITGAPSLPLIDTVVRELVSAACTPRVRYVVRVARARDIAHLEPARTVDHELHFSTRDVIAGHEGALADDDLPAPERVQHLCMLAGFLLAQGKGKDPTATQRAEAQATEAVELSASLSPLDRVPALMTLGTVLMVDGRLREARDAFANATQASLDAGNPPLAASALAQVGMAHGRLREWQPAAKCFAAAGRIHRRLGQIPQEMQLLLWQGDAELAGGNVEGAATRWLQVLGRAERGSSPAREALKDAYRDAAAQAHERLARLRDRAGDAAAAQDHRHRAAELGSDGHVMQPFS